MTEEHLTTEDELIDSVEDVADSDYVELVVRISRVLAAEDEEPETIRAGDRIVLRTLEYTIVFNDAGEKGWMVYRNTRHQPKNLTDEYGIENADDVINVLTHDIDSKE